MNVSEEVFSEIFVSTRLHDVTTLITVIETVINKYVEETTVPYYLIIPLFSFDKLI
jgi:hypothetical protein